jgi:hypothetical protein
MSKKLHPTTEVARILGIDSSRVRRLAVSRKLGRKLGRDWYFAESEIDNMRSRRPGRKPKLNLDTAIEWSAI